MIRRPPRSPLFPTRRSSDLSVAPLPSPQQLGILGTEQAKVWVKRGDVHAERQEDVVAVPLRSEDHTSELQSRLHLVCRLLLEKKNIREATEHEILSVCEMAR